MAKKNSPLGGASLIIIFIMVLLALLLLKITITGKVSSENVGIEIKIPEGYEKLSEVEPLLFQVNIDRTGESTQSRDVLIKSFLKEERGEQIELGSETIALKTQTSLVLSYHLPALRSGTYKLIVEAHDVNDNRLLGKTSKELFVDNDIRFSPEKNEKIYLFATIAGLVAIGIVLSITVYRRTRKRKGN